MLNGRLFFNKRVMSVSTWDGKTKYKVDETEEEERARLANWDKFLAEEEEDDDDQASKSKEENSDTKKDSKEGEAATSQ